jgi:LysM repeat protein
MRVRILLLLISVIMLAIPASASAYFGHVVSPGESLTSVAAADGLSVYQLAAANGISVDSELTAGSTLQIPTQSGPIEAVSTASSAGDGLAAEPEPTSSGGSYVVQPGDTLTAIAARTGTTVEQLAAANGLDPGGLLLAGSVIGVSGAGSSESSAAPEPASEPVSGPISSPPTGDGAEPTPETVSPSEVGSIAAADGVSPSLAEAIGYQESGFNNDLTSSTGATGVMQIEPGTWNYIGQDLASGPPPLSPGSAADNVRGGVLLLHSLLDQTGGNAAQAAAGYYQGLQSVQQHGLYSDTQQYVNDVLALQQRFGGP